MEKVRTSNWNQHRIQEKCSFCKTNTSNQVRSSIMFLLRYFAVLDIIGNHISIRINVTCSWHIGISRHVVSYLYDGTARYFQIELAFCTTTKMGHAGTDWTNVYNLSKWASTDPLPEIGWVGGCCGQHVVTPTWTSKYDSNTGNSMRGKRTYKFWVQEESQINGSIVIIFQIIHVARCCHTGAVVLLFTLTCSSRLCIWPASSQSALSCMRETPQVVNGGVSTMQNFRRQLNS